MNLEKCLFLDRDGIVNTDVGYAFKPSQIEFKDGIFEICNHFQHLGFLIIIVTNQSGIARGYYTESDFVTLNKWMTEEFSKRQISLTDIFHCPHLPDISGDCDCRKPKPGMFLSAINKYAINPQSSIMIGDKESDMIAAELAKIATRILLTENNEHSSSTSATINITKLESIVKILPNI